MNRKLFWISVIMGGAFIGTAFFAAVVILKLPRLAKTQVFSSTATLAWSSKVEDGIAIPACGSSSASVGCNGATPILTINWTDDTGICSNDNTQPIEIWIGKTTSTFSKVATVTCTQTSYTWNGGSFGVAYYYDLYYPNQSHPIISTQTAPALPSSCGSPPSPTLVVTPSSASIVVGGTQQFTATYDPDGSGPLSPTNVTASASWSSSNTGIATVAAGLAKGVAPGSVTISATSNGLTRTATLTVLAAVVPIVVTANVTPLSGLPGSSFVFTGSATGGNGGPYTYSWNFGDSTTGAFASTTHTYAIPGTYVVQLTASDSSGSGKSSPIAIVVSNPPPSIKITANPVFISQGSATTIQWVITGAVSCTYTSSPPDAVWNAQTSVTGGTFTVHPTQTTIYTITCTNGTLSSTATIRIIVGRIQESP